MKKIIHWDGHIFTLDHHKLLCGNRFSVIVDNQMVNTVEVTCGPCGAMRIPYGDLEFVFDPSSCGDKYILVVTADPEQKQFQKIGSEKCDQCPCIMLPLLFHCLGAACFMAWYNSAVVVKDLERDPSAPLRQSMISVAASDSRGPPAYGANQTRSKY